MTPQNDRAKNQHSDKNQLSNRLLRRNNIVNLKRITELN